MNSSKVPFYVTLSKLCWFVLEQLALKVAVFPRNPLFFQIRHFDDEIVEVLSVFMDFNPFADLSDFVSEFTVCVSVIASQKRVFFRVELDFDVSYLKHNHELNQHQLQEAKVKGFELVQLAIRVFTELLITHSDFGVIKGAFDVSEKVEGVVQKLLHRVLVYIETVFENIGQIRPESQVLVNNLAVFLQSEVVLVDRDFGHEGSASFFIPSRAIVHLEVLGYKRLDSC